MIEMWEHKTDHGLWKLHSPRWLKIITQLGLRHEKGLMMHQFGSRLALVHDEEEVTEALWILFSMACLMSPVFREWKYYLVKVSSPLSWLRRCPLAVVGPLRPSRQNVWWCFRTAKRCGVVRFRLLKLSCY